ncbi:MAG TPA: ATP-binding protein, partial [Candidatus Krumholzibacteria bacterium]|nr:ATP-binding protein [Candidatus Krumholzibacteria bacterium]
RRVMADVQRHLDGESDHYETEHRLRHRDGSWIWVLDRGRVIARDAAGRPLRAAGTHQDITARRREELRSRRAAAVREEAAVRLAHGSDEDAIQAAARAILADVGGMMGADGGVLLSHDPASGWCEPIHAWHDPAAGPRRPWTAGALAVLGAWREIEPGGVRASLALGADDPRPEGPLGELLAQRGSHALLLHSVRLGDDLAYVLAFEAGRAMRHWSEGDGETLRSVLESLGYAFERLHLHRAHEATRKQLETALQRAEQANLVKSTFLARMSHEIRTPLTAIVGFADILERGRERLGERDLYWVGQIRSNADHLVALLNDLLDISKIEAKELRVVREAVDVRAAIDTVATSMRVKAADKMLDFRVEIMPDVPLAIVSDGLRLRQILVNLVGNAVKFTERGSVEVAVRHEPAAGDGTGDLVIAVRDTGIGIADDQLEAVFQPFQQAAGLDHARFGGTGLGLDISRRLARMLGGDLTVVSGLGSGSTFTVRLPAEPAAPPAAAAQAAAPAAACAAVDGARVLLADDSPDNRTIVSFYLEEAGIVPECVADGAEAVAAVHAAQAAGRPYDLILMDMRMPVMDGYEATRTLRAQGVRTPIVALTAHAMAGDSEACLAFGCHGYLAKPIEPQGLIQTVASFLPQGRIPAAAPRRLRSRMADEPRFAVHLERYLGTLATIAEQLRTALADGDALQVESLAHRLHGTGASFGYPDISRVAADAEESLRAGADLEDVRGGIEELVELAEAARRGAPEPAGVPAT